MTPEQQAQVPNSSPPPSPRHGKPRQTNDTSSSPWWQSKTSGTPKQRRSQTPDLEWHIKWSDDVFPNGRVLLIDYISSQAVHAMSPGRQHVAVAAQEFQDLGELQRFYEDPKRANSAALRVIHVQNATWATRFLLTKFNIDHPSEIAGMQGFSKWARYERPRQRNGKPFPNGRAFREQTDPWRNISRTAFGLDYLKPYTTPHPMERKQQNIFSRKPVDAKMMHLNAYEDSRTPYGWDVSVQRLSVYVQRSLGKPGKVSPDIEIRNPYAKPQERGHGPSGIREGEVDLDSLDNSNTVIVFETSASMLPRHCLVQPRNDFEKRWRRLSFYLKREEAFNDAQLAAQCTNMVLTDVFHGLAVVWDDLLSTATDHVNILEDKIYENPADESRSPELWTNQAAWLKVNKIMWIHQDLVKQMQSQLRALAEFETEDGEGIDCPDWLASIPTDYEKLSHSVVEDLVQPTANLSDLMYKSVGIRDSRQSLQLGLSMWRLSWVTFIFLPLTFMVSFFGMNVDTFDDNPSVGWWFIAAAILMLFVLFLWYCVKHSLQRNRQTPYQRGLYEHLFDDMQEHYPQLWSSRGAVQDVEPRRWNNRIKWKLLRTWFSPERTIDKRLYTSLTSDGDDSELDTWARCKHTLLKRWLPQILAENRHDRRRRHTTDPVALAEIGRQNSHSVHSIRSEPVTVAELAKMSTPLAVADAQPGAVQQMSIYGLGPSTWAPPGSESSIPRHSDELVPSSGGDGSGLMIEERNLSDSSSDAKEGVAGGDYIGTRGG
ncbi:hypothetical protein KC349_g376 [Hortaea werneckii]|nr:hypothetical protein KC349_g376 [Hortaea werneckii]